MSDYTQLTDFSAKDALASGNPSKVIKGSEHDAEYAAISTAIASKADDDAVVHDTGNETIAGNKTFTGSITMTSKSINAAEGANVASTSDCNIWVGDGNTVHLTGTTTVTDWGTAPQAGARMWVICDAATPLTYNATTNDMNTAGQDYTAIAGDVLEVYARSASSYKVTIHRYSGGLKLITVNSPSAAASSNFTVDTTGRYKMVFRLRWNTANGELRFRFNNDSGALYSWCGTQYDELAASTQAASGANHISLSGGTTVTAGEYINGWIEWDVWVSDSTDAVIAGMTEYGASTSIAFDGWSVHGKYSGAADITSARLTVSAGTFTGTIKLYRYD